MKVTVLIATREHPIENVLSTLGLAAGRYAEPADSIRITFVIARPGTVEVEFETTLPSLQSAAKDICDAFRAAAGTFIDSVDIRFPEPPGLKATAFPPPGAEDTVELVALAVKQNAIKTRRIPTGEPITFRPSGGVRWEVEGQILTVKPSKVWKHGRTDYLSGETVSRRVDIPALGLVPLELHPLGIWDPAEEYRGEANRPGEECMKAIIEAGSRRMFRIEQVNIGGHGVENDCDLICEAAELYESGDYGAAREIIENLLVKDLRCIDAHALLGHWSFNRSFKSDLEQAMLHYQVGVEIAELSLGKDFKGVLPWNSAANRAYLECLLGYGLCLWRMADLERARDIFMRMLWLNPRDNQGVSSLIYDVDEGLPWTED